MPMIVMVGAFVAIGILRLPLVWVVAVGGGLGVASEYLKIRRG
jgi:chromate transporter